MSHRTGLLICILVGVLFFADAFFGSRTLIPAGFLYQYEPWRSEFPQFRMEKAEQFDLLFQFYPWAQFFKKAISTGQIPLWTQDNYLGTPFFANPQTALLFPLTWIHLLLPLRYSFTVIFMLKLILALAGMFLFLREQKLSPEASLLGAGVFSLSMHTVTSLAFPYSNVTIVFPWALLAAGRLSQRRSVSAMAVFSGLLTVIAVAGQPQSTVPAYLFIGLFAALNIIVAPLRNRDGRAEGFPGSARFERAGAAIEARRMRALPGLTAIGAAFVIAILVSAIQWLPSYEYFLESMVPVGPRILRSGFPYSVRNFLNVLVPDFFGNPARQDFWGFPGYVDAAFYSSIVAVLLTPFAFLRREKQRDPLLWFLLLILALSILLLLGVPLVENLLDLPGLRQVRRAKFVFLVIFALAVLAARGADYLFCRSADEEAASSRFNSSILATLTVMALLAGILVAFGFWQFRSYLTALGLLKTTLSHAAHSGAFLLLAAIAVPVLSQKWLKLVLPAILLLDLLIASFGLNARGSSQGLYPPLQIADEIQRRNARVYSFEDIFPPNTAMVYGIQDVRGYDVMTPRRFFEFLKEIDPHLGDVYSWVMHLDTKRIHSQTLLREDTERAIRKYGAALSDYLKTSASYYSVTIGAVRDNPGFFDLLSVEYLLLSHAAPPRNYVLETNHGPYALYRKPGSERARFYTHWIESEPKDVLRRMKFADLKNEVVVESRLPPFSGNPTYSCAIQEIGRSFNHTAYQVETGQSGIFVDFERYSSGWKAYVDGRYQPVFPADYLFRGIFLTPGKHQVELTYRPRSLYWGAALSVLGVVALVVCLVWVKRARPFFEISLHQP